MTTSRDVLKLAIARDIWRFNECPWDFDTSPSSPSMAELQKRLALDQAESIVVIFEAMFERMFGALWTPDWDAEIFKDLAQLDTTALSERLTGIYRVPVNDGAGPLNGSNEFVRRFTVGPIQHEAARRLDHFTVVMAAINAALAVEGQTFCPVCYRLILAKPEPCSGFLARCGRRLATVAQCRADGGCPEGDAS